MPCGVSLRNPTRDLIGKILTPEMNQGNSSHPDVVFCHNRNVVSTWDTMKVSGKYGLSTRGPCFDRVLVQNRQNPLLTNVLAALVGTAITDLMVSHDR